MGTGNRPEKVFPAHFGTISGTVYDGLARTFARTPLLKIYRCRPSNPPRGRSYPRLTPCTRPGSPAMSQCTSVYPLLPQVYLAPTIQVALHLLQSTLLLYLFYYGGTLLLGVKCHTLQLGTPLFNTGYPFWMFGRRKRVQTLNVFPKKSNVLFPITMSLRKW